MHTIVQSNAAARALKHHLAQLTLLTHWCIYGLAVLLLFAVRYLDSGTSCLAEQSSDLQHRLVLEGEYCAQCSSGTKQQWWWLHDSLPCSSTLGTAAGWFGITSQGQQAASTLSVSAVAA
jgi:hypothetical protein